jgi:hypothetical protein
VQRNVAPAAVHTLLGAVRAIEGNDRNAVAAWEAAISAGGSAHALTPLVADALLRLGDATRALEAIERASAPNDPALQRRVAAARIALGRHVDALRVADALVLGDAADLDAHWLAIHALFAGFVQRQGPGSDPAGRARLRDLAQRYIAAKGPHAALAADWAAAAQ